MQKYRTGEIKSFEFADLSGSHVISQPKFEAFAFKTLEGESLNREVVSEDAIRKERTFEKSSNFKIDDVVRDHRGLSRQEKNDIEKHIQEEVNRRLEVAYQDAVNEGRAAGMEEGRAASLSQFDEQMGNKIEEFGQILSAVQSQSDKILEKNRQDVYEFVKRFTKWIVMKEIDDKLYMENLLEKLILELNSRKNLIVKVGKKNFQQMPEVIKIVETKLGQLSNVRIEIVPEIHHPGIILESENGLINGTLEGVFENIDKIFEQVVGHE